VQLVAFVVDQFNVELPLKATDVGFAVNVNVGAGAAPTVTLTVCETEPPLPLQLSV